MQSLKYNLYVFSMERERSGTIVANRSREGLWLGGKNFFRTLKISRSDEMLFKSMLHRDNMPAIVLLSGGTAPHAVVIYDFLFFESSLFVAVEYVLSPVLASEILASVCGGYAEFSPDIIAYRQGSEDKVFNEKLRYSMYFDILRLSRRLMSVRNFGTAREIDDILELQDVVVSIATLVGVESEINAESYVPRDPYLPAQVFSGALTVATVFILAMITRGFSSDKVLRARICGSNLSFSIECGSEQKYEDALRYLERRFDYSHSMPFDFDMSGGYLRVAAIPVYEDEGVSTEVKIKDLFLLFHKNDKSME